MEPREANTMEDREAGGTAEEQADVTGRTGTSGELPGSVGGADASQPDGVGGADGERPNSSQATSLLQAAHEQLSHLDWALLMLIPAAELQAVDRTLSLDPVDVDKTAAQFLEAAEGIQRTFTELRMQEMACDEATHLQTEIRGLEAELGSMEALIGRIQKKLSSWQGVLAHHKASLDKSLRSV